MATRLVSSLAPAVTFGVSSARVALVPKDS
jgi:hypothetical protein